MTDKIDKILLKVTKPTRYTGGEFGSCVKDKNAVDIRYAFCFPDLYEVGMSHLGLRILYHMMNERTDTYCERVFMPWPDMIALMKEENIPLFTLETHESVKDFDILGFTLQYEMCYTNVLSALDLAGIPRRSENRDESHPLICAGGPCTYNPEPLADFIDFFLIGEGEEQTNEYLDVYKRCKKIGLSRRETIKEISKIDGVYVPAYYKQKYDGERIASFEATEEDAPMKIRKRIITDIDKTYFPEKIIVPYMEIVHDRINLEVFRGCIRGCRFCQAGHVYRPTRHRSPERLVEIAKNLINNSGYDEIGLSSLSTSDYPHLEELVDSLLEITEKNNISLSLPSLRIDNFSLSLMNKVQKVRKTGLTFAPEAGTQRMRDVINKGITEEEILNGAKTALRNGYRSIKLYFMLGLPYETNEDIEGIPLLAQKILTEAGGQALTVSVSSFVPKPHTPFQWARQDSLEELEEKHRVLLSPKISRKIKINYHTSSLSVLEGVFARGDRRLCRVLEKAVDSGCIFDAWSEYFSPQSWNRAFEECEIDPKIFTRERSYDEILPWDIIDCGVTKNHLMRENEAAKKGIVSPNCRKKCAGCGVGLWKAGECV